MGLKYLYDTNVFIDYLSDSLTNNILFSGNFLTNNEIIISFITRMEFLSHPNITLNEEIFFKNLIEQFDIVSITDKIEDEAIRLRKNYKLKLPDSIIAATAIETNSILVTKDIKDFKKVAEIMIY